MRRPTNREDYTSKDCPFYRGHVILLVAREAGVQTEAFYRLAVETGMRRGEICGLKWEDVDLSAERISVKRTLLKAGPNPELGIPKGVKKIRFHDLRHTCATLLMENDTHPKVVQERLGHSDISMTLNRYSHVSPTMQKSAAQLLGNAIDV